MLGANTQPLFPFELRLAAFCMPSAHIHTLLIFGIVNIDPYMNGDTTVHRYRAKVCSSNTIFVSCKLSPVDGVCRLHIYSYSQDSRLYIVLAGFYSMMATDCL